MARIPLLQLSGVTLGFGGNPLLAGVDLVVQPGDRLVLVGRNGSGKSTLMKIMAGLVEPDGGAVSRAPGVHPAYMEQDPELSAHATLGDFAAGALPPEERYRVAIAAEGLGFDPTIPCATASGGERRRAALARLLAPEPGLLLLDEPTNHLDIAAIAWLEAHLRQTRAAMVMISHDRAFLRALGRGTLWLDRGELRRADRGFDEFEQWRETVWAEEDATRHKLDRKIRAEGRWAVEGISARRKRNQGRLRALQAMRAERAGQLRRQGSAAMALDAGPRSGRLVVEAEDVAKAFGERVILRDLSLRVQRGDRIALMGPNGAGKTTALNILTGTLEPDSGRLRLGTNLEIAVFDQNRARLDPEASLWDNLTGDPGMRVQGRSDQVMVRGAPRHVAGYLKEFLFDETQMRSPVRALSGGERARLLLAQIMARQSNLLVLDEPTNDLDIETLDLLQELIADYAGTVLLVSHDRDFIDRVATATLVLGPGGQTTLYAGGYSDAVAQGARIVPQDDPPPAAATQKAAGSGVAAGAALPAAGGEGAAPGAIRALNFTERHRLETLPGIIARLEAEIARLSEFLARPDLFATEPAKARKAAEGLAERQARLSRAEEEWLSLAERDESANGR